MNFHSLLNIFFPPFCPICHKEIWDAHNLCSDCWAQTEFIYHNFCHCCMTRYPDIELADFDLCPDCLQTPKPYEFIRSATIYNDISKDLILKFKHGDHTYLTRLFAIWMNMTYQHYFMNQQIDLILPIPLYSTRLLSRTYNQAQFLAQALSKTTQIPVKNQYLQRHKKTKSQGKLSKTQRQKNLNGAFRLNHKSLDLRGKNILLIDDVVTTGSTIEAASHVLKKAKANKIYGLTLARAMPSY